MSVLLIDLRNSGDSDRKSSGDIDYSFGLVEYRDTLGAWKYLQEQGWDRAQIGLWGGSMGGSTTLIALAREPLVACAWLDSMMCSPKQSMKNSAFNEVAFLRAENGTDFGNMLFDVANGVYSSKATNNFDTHMQAPLYYTADYNSRMTGFFAGCLASGEEASGEVS